MLLTISMLSDVQHRGGEFQSAPPHGGRLSDVHEAERCPLICFNPRPRTGGDDEITAGRRDTTRVSIRAPARGATVGALNALTSYV